MKKEKELSKIYHLFWDKFNDKEFSDSTKLFGGRLIANGFDLSYFKNKVCLDAGCGSGRYVQALLELGAKEVVGVDLDVKIAKKRVRDKRAKIIEGDIRNIPYPDNYFDFIVCNGVLHHTKAPKQIVKEFKRVLKDDGKMFFYLVDKNTLDWEIINRIRKSCKDIPYKQMGDFIRYFFEVSEPKIFNFCDIIYAPIQTIYNKEMIKELFKGFKIRYMQTPYTNYDRKTELRFIVEK